MPVNRCNCVTQARIENHGNRRIFLSRSYTSVPEALQLLEKLEDAARERPDLVNPVIEKFLDQLPSLS